MNGVPKMSVIRKVCSEMHLLIKELFLLNLKAPPEIQNTERFSYRKFVSTDFQNKLSEISYRFIILAIAINEEYVVKNENKSKLPEMARALVEHNYKIFKAPPPKWEGIKHF